MLFRWKGKGNESWIWCNELLQEAKGALEERENYTWVKTHAMVAKKCSHKYYFFEIMQLSISTKPILKEVFINYTQSKVVQ